MPFNVHAIEHGVAEYSHCVIELRALQLVYDEDVEESLEIFKERDRALRASFAERIIINGQEQLDLLSLLIVLDFLTP